MDDLSQYLTWLKLGDENSGGQKFPKIFQKKPFERRQDEAKCEVGFTCEFHLDILCEYVIDVDVC